MLLCVLTVLCSYIVIYKVEIFYLLEKFIVLKGNMESFHLLELFLTWLALTPKTFGLSSNKYFLPPRFD